MAFKAGIAVSLDILRRFETASLIQLGELQFARQGRSGGQLGRPFTKRIYNYQRMINTLARKESGMDVNRLVYSILYL